ncbi:MAG: hypothetical protein J5793_00090 [Clostridia bacterium]|nr:hypothetical protein [Clostridia bacterium]
MNCTCGALRIRFSWVTVDKDKPPDKRQNPALVRLVVIVISVYYFFLRTENHSDFSRFQVRSSFDSEDFCRDEENAEVNIPIFTRRLTKYRQINPPVKTDLSLSTVTHY